MAKQMVAKSAPMPRFILFLLNLVVTTSTVDAYTVAREDYPDISGELQFGKV